MATAHKSGSALRTSAYLALDEGIALGSCSANPQLARRLPPDLALRFHALPLAEDHGRVTVVMADPEDIVAREAVVSVLGPRSCVIQGDAMAIDAVLDQIWGRQTNPPLDLVICAAQESVSDQVRDYALAWGTLLGAHVGYLETTGDAEALAREGAGAKHDLLIVEEAKHPLIEWLQTHAAPAGGPDRRHAPPLAVLVARCPRWPLKRMLLIIQGARVDDAAVEWVVRLARASSSAVTVLAVVPPLPAMYKGLSRMGQGLPALLATDTALGRGMRQVARQLVAWEIDGTLRLRQGVPDLQIRREVIEVDPDLVVVGTRPCARSVRRLAGDLVQPLVRWADRPVLVAQTIA